MDKCINTKHPEFIELAKQANMNPLVLKSKIGVWQERNNSDEFPTLEEILNPNEVNYQLKIVNALINLTIPKSDTRYAMEQKPEVLTLRLNSKQQPYIEINIRKRLRGKGVNDTQIDFIFDYMKSNNIQEISTEELALELASKYGYSVEVNTAKTNEEKQVIQRGDNEEFTFNGFIYEYKNGEYLKDDEIIDLIEYESAKHEAFTQPNTQHYSNLSAPGGTNYTENEISIPLITPSIKGHAQFSTDNGIGWFRSDEQIIGRNEIPAEDLEEIRRMGYSGINFDDTAQKGTGKLTKTRRILEVQSDLFQKGRDREDIAKVTDEQIEEFRKLRDNVSYDEAKKYLDSIKENQFLQLLNKDNNWVTFFIKSIIQDSAKKGYEKVLFPKGETAAKIEGHETIAEEIARIDNEILKLKDKPQNLIEYKTLADGRMQLIFNGKPSYIRDSQEELQRLITIDEDARDKKILDLKSQKQQLKSQGIEKLKPIEAFYEIKVGNILEKQFGKDNVKTVTDEYGNEWREITIDKKRDLSPVLLQKSETKKKVSINKLAKQLNKRFNVGAEIISQEKAKELNPKYNGEPAFFDVSQSKAYLVEGIADKTSTVHEIFTHPFLIKIEKDDNELYNNLLKEAKSDQDIVSFVEENYAGYSDKTKDHEIIARAIDLQVQGKLDSEKHKNLIEVIMDFFSQLASTLKEIFSTEKEITSLSTLEDVVTLVLEGKSFINLSTLGIKTETENTMFQIIGLKAIENIKDPELKKNLEDKLKKAKELEKKGENPDYIWEVTHFERGEDGLWRLEVADVEFDAKVFESHKNNTPNEKVNIEHYIGKESPFFELYPELKDVKVTLLEGVMSAYNERERTIKLSNEKTESEVYFDFLHEFQHFIQEREGFSLGGNDEYAFRMLPRKVFDKVFEDSKQRIFRSLEKSVRNQLKNSQKLTTQDETMLRNIQKVIELSNNNLLDYQDKVELLDYMFQYVEMREDNPIDKYLIYFWLLGEREATNTKERAKLSMQERMKIRPTKSMPEAPDFSKFFVTKKMITSSLVSTAFQKEFMADLDLFCSYFSASYPFQEFVKTHNGLVKLTKERRLSDNGRLCNAYYSIDKKIIFVAKEATGKDLFSAVLEYYLLENEDIDVQDILFDMVDKINSRDDSFKVSSTDDIIHNLFINEKMKDFLKTQESTMEEYKNLFDEFISIIAEKGALKKQGVLDILKRSSRVEVTDYFAAEKKLRDYPDVFSMEVLNNIEEC